MSSRAILLSTAAHVSDLLDGYAIRYQRWSDADLNGDGGFVLIRFPGTGGESTVDLQQIDVMLMIFGRAASANDTHDVAAAIQRRFREGGTEPGVVRFEVLGALAGPMFLENDRPYWQMNVRVYVEDA